MSRAIFTKKVIHPMISAFDLSLSYSENRKLCSWNFVHLVKNNHFYNSFKNHF
jgi:hypothetical protein